MEAERITALAGGILEDVQDLVRKEFALAKAEINEEIGKVKTASISLGAGGITVLLGGILATLMIVHLIHAISDESIPLWGCYGIVTVIVAAAGAYLLFRGKKQIEGIHLVPDRTVTALKENFNGIRGS